jgi:hypothetical protein
MYLLTTAKENKKFQSKKKLLSKQKEILSRQKEIHFQSATQNIGFSVNEGASRNFIIRFF